MFPLWFLLFVFSSTLEGLRVDLNPSNMFRNAARVKVRFPRIRLSVLGQMLSVGIKETAVYCNFSVCTTCGILMSDPACQTLKKYDFVHFIYP